MYINQPEIGYEKATTAAVKATAQQKRKRYVNAHHDGSVT